MLYRKIAEKIKNHLRRDSSRMLLVAGARQIGKSYIIREVGTSLYKNFVEINMEEDKLADRLFSGARTVEDFYLALGSIAGNRLGTKEDTLVFIDEIQAYDHLLTLVKFLMADGRFSFIGSGSQLGVALKNTQSLPLGSVRIEYMYPMDFEEFLIACGIGGDVLSSMLSSFQKQESLPESVHNYILGLFRKYLLVGGLPQAVEAYLTTHNVMEFRSIQRDVMNLYGIDASKYEESRTRLKIRRIYEMVPSNLEKVKKRVVVKDIEDKEWKRFANYADEFDYLISSGVALEVKAVCKPSYPLVENSSKNLLKLYMNDVGILSGLFYGNNINAVLQDIRSVNLGSLYESAVAQELRAHGYNLFYYDNKKNGEVDFLIDDMENLSNIPLEVKSGKDYTVHSALNKFLSIREYNIHKAVVLSNERKVYIKDGVTYMPVYYIMFFRKDEDTEICLA